MINKNGGGSTDSARTEKVEEGGDRAKLKMEDVGDIAEAEKMEKGGDSAGLEQRRRRKEENHSRGRRQCWNNEGE